MASAKSFDYHWISEAEYRKYGSDMVEYPLDPPLAKILLAGADMGCLEEVRRGCPEAALVEASGWRATAVADGDTT